MKPILYDKTGKTQLGVLEHCINCIVEEERNGAFTLTLTYPITDELHHQLIYDNIIIAKANDEYDNQQFRIMATERIIKGTITVKAVHISYDLVYDLTNVSSANRSCENALNELFRNSHFSKDYKGYSNIVNSQTYSAQNKNIWDAIVGSVGSIVDTYGKGPEIIRDNKNIHVLNSRGTDRGVVIEYSVNMLEESLEVDTTDIVTSIYGYARYTDDENNEHVVSAPRINSGIMNNYAHPFIVYKDYTDRFEQGVTPTVEQISSLVEADFATGIDQPKCNYTINFVPLSKCAGYENIQDQIHLCDTVTIKDKRYNIDTKAEVISYIYNVLLERYNSMELGDARNTLAQTIVKPAKEKLEKEIEDKIIIDNKNYPDTLPKTSVITLHAGLGTIQIDWTYERQSYYSYQLYGSTQQGFNPTSADLLYEGQASSFLHTVEPGSTWYFRVRGKNSYGRYNEFSDEAGITCFIIDGDTTYIEKAGILDAYIGTLNLDRGWVGELKGHWIDARNLTVTDGNGVRTLDIDSFGKVKIDASEIKIASKSIETIISEADAKLEAKITLTAEQLTTNFTNADKGLQSQITQTAQQLTTNFTSADSNLQSQITQNANAISTKVSWGDVGTIVTQNATSWGLSIYGKLSGTNYNFDGTNFSIGNSSGQTTAYHAAGYSKWTHSDGSWTRVDANGMTWSKGGTTTGYHCLLYAGEYICDSESTVTITCPSEFHGKPFKVVTAIKRIYTSTDEHVTKGYFPLISFYAEALNVNHYAGTFQVYASVRAWNRTSYGGYGTVIGDGTTAEKQLVKPVVAYWVFV